jgi:hypothetical protein
MTTAHPFLRSILVSALALSLTVAPYCTRSMGASCAVAESVQHDQGHDQAPGQCCCGVHCDCINCPAAHSQQQQQNKKESPVNQTDSRDIAKTVSAVSYSLFSAAEKSAHVTYLPNLSGECVHLQTLISQHTCLRV